MSMTMALIAGGLQAGLSIVGGRKAKQSGADLAMLNLERLEDRYDQNIEMIDKIYEDNLQKTMYENTLQRFNYVENTTDQLGSVVSDLATTGENADLGSSSYAGQTIQRTTKHLLGT
jgi:translation elongation factor EF-Ts